MIEHDFVSGAAFGPEKCRNSRAQHEVLGYFKKSVQSRGGTAEICTMQPPPVAIEHYQSWYKQTVQLAMTTSHQL